jgi:hypothetical protein
MDYPQLNLIFGLVLVFTLVVSIGLRILLSKGSLPAWLSVLSWVTLALNLLSALYIETLFLQRMTPSFNMQIGIGLLVIGGIGALLTAFFYQRDISPQATVFLAIVQVIVSLAGVVVAYGLYRSLVPV